MSIDINKIKNRTLIKYPFFGSVVAALNYEETRRCETAATDGSTIYYNPDFVSTLTEDEQTFIFAHEVCHVAFDHIFRSEGKDSELWNIATDAVINALLKNDGLTLVKGGVDIPEAINHDAEEMYKKLLEERNDQNNRQSQGNSQNPNKGSSANNNSSPQGQNSQNSSSNSSPKEATSSKSESQDGGGASSNGSPQNTENETNRNVGHDNHGLWKKAIEERKQKNQESQNGQNNNASKEKESIFDKLFGRNKRQNESQKQPNEDINAQGHQKKEQERRLQEEITKISEMGERKAFKQNKITKKKQLEELREALAKESRGAGSSTNSETRIIENIGTSTPLIDWRRLLKEAVKINLDWSYRNATIEEGVITAHLEKIPEPETEILLDTSGSIDEVLLRNFLRECKNILQVSKIKAGCFDTRFYGFHEIRNESDIDNMPFIGRGGTNFDIAVNAFSRRVENKIIFTDGDANMPSKRVDAIWIVFGNKKINPPGGKVIYISREQLNRLSFYNDDVINKGRSR